MLYKYNINKYYCMCYKVQLCAKQCCAEVVAVKKLTTQYIFINTRYAVYIDRNVGCVGVVHRNPGSVFICLCINSPRCCPG